MSGMIRPMAAKKKTRTIDPLVGKYFHSRDDAGVIKWQGLILGKTGGLYLCQLFGWFDGRTTNQQLIPLREMRRWEFFNSSVEMGERYEQYTIAREQRAAGLIP